jgi:hypothetical protein
VTRVSHRKALEDSIRDYTADKWLCLLIYLTS